MNLMIRKRILTWLIPALLLIYCSSPAWCWDKFAHEIVTQIAYDRLTPTARDQANSLIEALVSDPDVMMLPDKYKPYNFVTAGSWMDDMKPSVQQPDGTREFSTWHYIDLPLDPNLTRADVIRYRDHDTSNVYLTIEMYCIPTLKNRNAPLAARARALGFLLHLAGDIHQPLHCAGPERGGNTHKIAEIPSADPTWPVKNLHAFWDGAYRYSGASGKIALVLAASDLPRITVPGEDPVAAAAETMMKQYPPQSRVQAADLDPADWALESNRIATEFAFPQAGSALSPKYVQRAHDIACKRLTIAGVRLASLLNSLLTDTNK